MINRRPLSAPTTILAEMWYWTRAALTSWGSEDA